MKKISLLRHEKEILQNRVPVITKKNASLLKKNDKDTYNSMMNFVSGERTLKKRLNLKKKNY